MYLSQETFCDVGRHIFFLLTDEAIRQTNKNNKIKPKTFPTPFQD